MWRTACLRLLLEGMMKEVELSGLQNENLSLNYHDLFTISMVLLLISIPSFF